MSSKNLLDKQALGKKKHLPYSNWASWNKNLLDFDKCSKSNDVKYYDNQ